MQRKQTPQLKVYYDGLCHLCSREIAHYRKLKGSERIDFVDISAEAFDAKAEGLDPIQVNKKMHVRQPDGKVVVGVDAFIAIWEVLPGYGMAARLAKMRGANLVLRVGYQLFASARPYLPKRKRSCETLHCPP